MSLSYKVAGTLLTFAKKHVFMKTWQDGEAERNDVEVFG